MERGLLLLLMMGGGGGRSRESVLVVKLCEGGGGGGREGVKSEPLYNYIQWPIVSINVFQPFSTHTCNSSLEGAMKTKFAPFCSS